ncbi:MAG: zinc-ribbon domain-containing protein [Oscillibacter sp.]|nr:zinc-ribbon domain-containing protein [Oscillibacter sp.]
MKHCTNCGREYPNDKAFCPVCGVKLEDEVTSKPEPWYQQWLSVIMGTMSLIVAWEWNWEWGLILAISAIILGYKSPNRTAKVLSYICSAVTIVLIIHYLIS